MENKQDAFNKLVYLQKSLNVDFNLFKKTLIDTFETKELIGFIIDDLVTSNWPCWLKFLQDLTNCTIVPNHHYNDYKLMSNDWFVWYKNIYSSLHV